MYNDSLFNAFARSFEARSQSDMSMAEYLESCRGDPMRYANAAERLLAAIGEPQMIDTAKAGVPGRVDHLRLTNRRQEPFRRICISHRIVSTRFQIFRHRHIGLASGLVGPSESIEQRIVVHDPSLLIR